MSSRWPQWSGLTSIAVILVLRTLSISVDGFVTPNPLKSAGIGEALPKSAPVAQPFTNSFKQYELSNGRENTRINMSPATAMGITTGGILGGALHAIAGPDHLAALLPRCVGQRWYRAGRVGALWGTGHGISAAVLGLLAFGLKNRISLPVKFLHSASSAMDIAVGASLVIIGLLGMKEAREWKEEIEVMPQSLSAAATEQGTKSSQKRVVLFNGFLHGFSWDGTPSLAPALAVATWRGSLSFLLAYGLGTTIAMTIATVVIGESTLRAGELFGRPDLPQKLSMISSILAMGVGLFWCFLAMK